MAKKKLQVVDLTMVRSAPSSIAMMATPSRGSGPLLVRHRGVGVVKAIVLTASTVDRLLELEYRRGVTHRICIKSSKEFAALSTRLLRELHGGEIDAVFVTKNDKFKGAYVSPKLLPLLLTWKGYRRFDWPEELQVA